MKILKTDYYALNTKQKHEKKKQKRSKLSQSERNRKLIAKAKFLQIENKFLFNTNPFY